MSLYFRTQNKFITITGQTYHHRAMIKNLGGVFVPDRKAWRLPFSEDSFGKVEKLCLDSGGGSLDTEGSKEVKIEQVQPLKSKEEKEEKVGMSISELYAKIETVLACSFSRSFWVVGEIESIAYRSQGVYLTLAEKDSRGGSQSVNAIIWQNTLKTLSQKHTKKTLEEVLHEGLRVCISCRLNLYKGRGSLSLTVQDLNPSYTKGLLALEKEKTVKKLKALDLYSANKKLLLARFPFKVGLITAEGSRAYSDFCHQLTEKSAAVEVFFVAATMQGAGASSSLKKAFMILEKKNCDIIVLTRGGGSASDLRVFDDFDVASLVAKAKVPVLAAIGHHEDHPVCEEVCFQSLKTPTAAAEFILRHFEQGALYLEELALKMTKNLEGVSEFYQKKHEFFCLKLSEALKNSCGKSEIFLTEKKNQLNHEALSFIAQKELKHSQLSSGLEASSQKNLVSSQEKVSFLVSHLRGASAQSLSYLGLQLESWSSKLLSYDPRPWLKKGWTQLYRRNGSLVKNLDSLGVGDNLEAGFLDGKASLEVKKLEKRRK